MRSFKDGDVVNYWTITGFDKLKGKYICNCVCGNISYVSSPTLKNGKSKSCGCKQKEKVWSKIEEENFPALRKKIFDNYKNAAIKRKYMFNLSFEEFSNIIIGNCHYCNHPPSMIYKYGRGCSELDYNKFKYNGVDRVDNTIGYQIDNCVSCCKICNNSKASLTEKEWNEWIIRIYNNKFSQKFND